MGEGVDDRPSISGGGVDSVQNKHNKKKRKIADGYERLKKKKKNQKIEKKGMKT